METVIDAADIKDYADEYCRMHKDAARYRWLREQNSNDSPGWHVRRNAEDVCVDLDAEIDKAMGAKNE